MKATVRPNFLPPVQLNFLLRAHFDAVESASWLLHPVAILVPENCRGLSLSLSLTLCFSLSFQLPLSWMSARSFRISLKLDFNPGWLNLWRFGSLRSSVWKLFCRRIPRCVFLAENWLYANNYLGLFLKTFLDSNNYSFECLLTV